MEEFLLIGSQLETHFGYRARQWSIYASNITGRISSSPVKIQELNLIRMLWYGLKQVIHAQNPPVWLIYKMYIRFYNTFHNAFSLKKRGYSTKQDNSKRQAYFDNPVIFIRFGSTNEANLIPRSFTNATHGWAWSVAG